MNRPVTAPAAVDYPSSDGQPMAESEFQLIPLIDAISALRLTRIAELEARLEPAP